MIEIVRRGVSDGDKVAQFSCGECKSLLKAKKSDGESVSDHDGESIKFACPVCEEDIFVPVSEFKVPKRSPRKSSKDDAERIISKDDAEKVLKEVEAERSEEDANLVYQS